MAPKRNAREPTPSSVATTQTSTTGAGSVPASTPSKKSGSSNQSPQEIALGIWQNYLDATPQRTKLIDVFMAFLMVVGVLQFVYCVIVGNYVSSMCIRGEESKYAHVMTAFQRLPFWLLGDGGTVRTDGYVALHSPLHKLTKYSFIADTNQRREQGRIRRSFSRKVRF